MKADSIIIIGAAALGLALIYHVSKKPAAAANAPGAQSYVTPGTTIGQTSPFTIGNVFGTAGTASLGTNAAKVFGNDPYGIYGTSTIGAQTDGSIQSLLNAGGIMGAFQ